MCCFSGGIAATIKVSGTQIYARADGSDRQFLIYSMVFSAQQDVAMILPLPVPPSSPEDAVRFIDLSGYAELFDDLARAFPEMAVPASIPLARMAPQARAAPLEVKTVGSFEASFVPTLADFSRLDKRFRMSDEVWRQLPDYRDFGFAVFKLRQPGWFSRLLGKRSSTHIHPMAFSFPTRHAGRLFFPTVHVHDGSVHREAHFDHTLYFQPEGSDPNGVHKIAASSVIPAAPSPRDSAPPPPIERGNLAGATDLSRTHGILSRAPGYKLRLLGNRSNQDTVLALQSQNDG